MHAINSDSDLECNMDKKDEILDKLGKMSVDQLDKLRDEKQVELKDAMHKYSKSKDDLMVLKHNKRKELIEQGNSLSKTEQLMRGDEAIFNQSRLVLALSEEKNQLKLTIEIVSSYFWKARA